MAALVPGRQSRAWLTALSLRQGSGGGEPTYMNVPQYDEYSTGEVVAVPEEPANTTATHVPSSLQFAIPLGDQPHLSPCGCGACQAQSGKTQAGVSG